MMRSDMREAWRRGLTHAGVMASVLLLAGGAPGALGRPEARAQDSSLRAERTVEYKLSKAQDLSAKVGPVKIASVEFSNLGRGYGKGGIGGRMRPSTGSEVSTTIRAHFLAENPSSDEWEVTFTLEFLDKGGKVIERVTKKSSWEGEAKPFDFDHEVLEYVLPMTAEVRIKMEGRLD